MLIRRTLLLASMLVLLWAAPAHADHVYGHVLDTTVTNPPTVGPTSVVPTSVVPTTVRPGVEGTSDDRDGRGAGGDLARTGSDSIVPLIQAAIVLMGGGLLLVLVARRRRTDRRALA